MIVLIRAIFFFVVIHNFGNSNASEINGKDLLGPPGQQPYLTSAKDEGPDKTVTYLRRKFGVWYHPGGKSVVKVRLIATKNFIPANDEDIRVHNIQTRFVCKDDVRFAVYMTSGKIIGAQYAPKTQGWRGSEIKLAGLPYPNLTDPNWTFIYEGRKIGVWQDHTGRPRAVGLLPTNIIPTKGECDKFKVRTHMVHQEGIFFLVHVVAPTGIMLGVELAPKWNPPY